jgi:cytidylate kinase
MAVDAALLAASDSTTTSAIIEAFKAKDRFKAVSAAEMKGVVDRDEEDANKLAAGVKLAVDKGVLSAEPPVEPVTTIDVMGKTADQVADEIIVALGAEATTGCVMILTGLSGTGKGTTTELLKKKLRKAVTWSNGNVFRALTLLAVTHCESASKEFSEDILTPELLKECMTCLTFDKFEGSFDTKIYGFGLDLQVSKIQNTTLKDPKVGKNIPTVAKMTQGEVVGFAGGAAEKLRAAGFNVLVEGRSQTLDHIRTPHRFELTLSDPTIIGMRRAAQRMMGYAQVALEGTADPTPEAIQGELEKALEQMAA